MLCRTSTGMSRREKHTTLNTSASFQLQVGTRKKSTEKIFATKTPANQRKVPKPHLYCPLPTVASPPPPPPRTEPLIPLHPHSSTVPTPTTHSSAPFGAVAPNRGPINIHPGPYIHPPRPRQGTRRRWLRARVQALRWRDSTTPEAHDRPWICGWEDRAARIPWPHHRDHRHREPITATPATLFSKELLGNSSLHSLLLVSRARRSSEAHVRAHPPFAPLAIAVRFPVALRSEPTLLVFHCRLCLVHHLTSLVPHFDTSVGGVAGIELSVVCDRGCCSCGRSLLGGLDGGNVARAQDGPRFCCRYDFLKD